MAVSSTVSELDGTSYGDTASTLLPDGYDGNSVAHMKRADDIRATFAILTIIGGTIGNTLCFIIMRGKTLKATSAGVFFSYIAIWDTATVYVGQLLFLVGYAGGVQLIPYHPWSCKIIFFLLFSCGDIAVWLLLAATVDRFIAITFPLKVKTLCTPKRAHTVAWCLMCGAGLKNLHLFWTRGRQVIVNADGTVEVINCGFPSPSSEQFELYIRPWIGFTLYAFIPIAAVLLLNVVISYKLHRHAKSRPRGNTSTQASGGEKNTTQLTAMLLSIAIVFLILITPSITVLVARPYVVHSRRDEVRMAYVAAIADSMAYINHSINFLLYCLTASGFRKEARRLLCCLSNQVDVDNSTVNTEK